MALFDFLRKASDEDEPADAPLSLERAVQFDEEERQAIRSGWPNGFMDCGTEITTDFGYTIPEERTVGFRRRSASRSLIQLAAKRLQRGESARAIGTCLKSLSLSGGDYEAWLIVAKARARLDDLGAAEEALEKAEKAAGRVGIVSSSPFWIETVEGLRDWIDRGRLRA